jgi:hypothetical protein
VALLLDAYEQKARLVPALLVVLPAAVVLAAVGWSYDRSLLGPAAGMAVALGAPVAMANYTRRVGKNVQDRLWERWGGPPTRLALRHRSGTNPHLLAQVHASLEAIANGLEMPTADDERSNPDDADQRYDAAVEVVQNRLRSTNAGKLLFQENCSYGYHRNLLGLRPLGIAMAAVAAVAATALAGIDLLGLVALAWPLLLVAAAVSVIMLAFWLWAVDEHGVRRAAAAYSQAFLGTVAALEQSNLP